MNLPPDDLTASEFPMDEILSAALRGNHAARFLATRDENGIPSLVPALSANLADGQIIRVAAILPAAVKSDLLRGGPVTLLVIDEKLRWWSLAVSLAGWADGASGERVRRWVLLRPTELRASGRYSSLGLVAEYSLLRVFGVAKGDDFTETLPREVAGKLQTLQNVKALAFVNEQDQLEALPCQSLMPAGPGALVCGTRTLPRLRSIPPGAPVAACVLTFEPNAYQIQGRFEGLGGGLFRTAATFRVAGLRPALA